MNFFNMNYNIKLEIKDMDGFQLLNQFSNKIKQINSLFTIMDQYEDSHNLKKYRISEITIKEAMKIYQNIQSKFYKYYTKYQSGTWFENELRLFIWILICYMEFYKKQIRELGAQDWEFFSRVFYTKKQVLFQYQAKIIFNYSLCLKRWTQQQDLMLAKTVNSVIKIKWCQIAKSLFIISQQKYVRTSKQCRQRWLNHLDPSKTKLQWTLQQSKALIETVLQKGKKWASLVQILSCRRSQHSIKNKYNSMLTRQKKMTPRQTEEQNCKSILNQLEKTIILNQKQFFQSLASLQNKKFKKQNQPSVMQQKYLQKSNASLSLRTEPGNQQQPNLDDLILGIQFKKSMECTIQNIQFTSKTESNQIQNKLSSLKRKISKKNNLNEEFNIFEDENSMESLVFLHDLKLMIRESQLDR